MGVLKNILRTALGLAFVLAALSLLLPRHARVERSVVMAVPASTVFPFINDLRQFNTWSPWARIDSATQYEFTGPSSGVGASMTWHSEHPHVGKGSQHIIESVPDERVTAVLHLGDGDNATSTIVLAPQANSTRVTWNFDTDLGFNPLSRYFGLMLDSMVGSNYEQGLATLKSMVETAAPQTRPMSSQDRD